MLLPPTQTLRTLVLEASSWPCVCVGVCVCVLEEAEAQRSREAQIPLTLNAGALMLSFPREANRFLPVFYFSNVNLPREPSDCSVPFISPNQSDSW